MYIYNKNNKKAMRLSTAGNPIQTRVPGIWNILTFFLSFCRLYDKIFIIMWEAMQEAVTAFYMGNKKKRGGFFHGTEKWSRTAATVLGIISLILAILGGILFGVIGAGIALILGIVAVVLGVNAKKATDGAKGQAGFICGLLGIIFAAVFAAGCAICGAVESSGTNTSYTCYGCIGGSCMLGSDADDAADDLEDMLDQMQDLYN